MHINYQHFIIMLIEIVQSALHFAQNIFALANSLYSIKMKFLEDRAVTFCPYPPAVVVP